MVKPRLALALAVGSALVLVALAARGTSPVTYGGRAGGDGETEVVSPAGDVLDSEVGGSEAAGSLVVLLIVVVSVAVISVIGLLFAFGGFRRRRCGVGAVVEASDGESGRAEVPAILVERAAEALDELRGNADRPPGDAVIAAWLALERAAEESGAARLGHQTPTEFTGDLLRRYEVDERATGTLRGVYQRARFGTAGVTAADARTAADALARIVRGLR